MKFKVGQIVKISNDNDNDSYNDYRNMNLIIILVTRNQKESPFYDNTMKGMGLYDLRVEKTKELVPFSLYDYELRPV